MRLLNTKTFKIEEYYGRDVPKYAILSHTWGREEISFADYHDPKYTSISWNTRLKAGWRKIKNTCEQAARQKLNHVWIDTCCIDKTSSAELSEAINSMAEWYRQAAVCLVYLEDISQEEAGPIRDQFTKCRWFTRGWTLQELIFPKLIRFYDNEWQYLGDKFDMKAEIMEVTNIDSVVLNNSMALSSICVAKRMSWAARRQSTRLEDTAYSLMGIFDVHMPLLYGEGKKAFQRLQEEILKKSSDPSILLWDPAVPGMSYTKSPAYTSIFASSPDQFFSGRRVMSYDAGDRLEIALMYAGLRIVAPTIVSIAGIYIILPCRYEDDYSGPIAIKVHEKLSRTLTSRRPSSVSEPLSVTRDSNAVLENTADDVHQTVALQKVAVAKYRTLVLTTQDSTMSRLESQCIAVWLKTSPQFDDVFEITSVEPNEGWNSYKRVMRFSASWVDHMGDGKMLSNYQWNRKDGLGSLKLSVLYSQPCISREPEGSSRVFGTFNIAFDGDAETERLDSVFETNSRGVPGNATCQVLQVAQVCGGRDLALVISAQHIMGDLVCTVEMAFEYEQEKPSKVLLLGPEYGDYTRFADVQIGRELILPNQASRKEHWHDDRF
jgi:hypothetical protein